MHIIVKTLNYIVLLIQLVVYPLIFPIRNIIRKQVHSYFKYHKKRYIFLKYNSKDYTPVLIYVYLLLWLFLDDSLSHDYLDKEILSNHILNSRSDVTNIRQTYNGLHNNHKKMSLEAFMLMYINMNNNFYNYFMLTEFNVPIYNRKVEFAFTYNNKRIYKLA